MANKVLKFNSETTKKSPTETYLDISMTSKYDSHTDNYLIAKNVDVDAVKGSIHNIFNWLPGERVLNPEFGNTVLQYLYEGINNYTAEQIISEIRHIVAKWEPRAEIDRVEKIESVNDVENNTIQLKIIWHVVGLPTEQYYEVIG